VSEKPKWLGVDAVDGASLGPLVLQFAYPASGTEASSWLVGESGNEMRVTDWCQPSEVNARTLDWIRSIAALDPKAQADAELLAAAEAAIEAAVRLSPGEDHPFWDKYEAYDAAKEKRSKL